MVVAVFSVFPGTALAAGKGGDSPALPRGTTPAAAARRKPGPVISAKPEMRRGADEKTGPPPQADRNERSACTEESGDGEFLLGKSLDLIAAAQESWVKGDEEKSIEALDEAYASILEVSAEDDPNLVQ